MKIRSFEVRKVKDEHGNYTIGVKVNSSLVSIPLGTSKSKFEYKFELSKEIKKARETLKKIKNEEISEVKEILKIDKKYRCLPVSLALLKELAKEKGKEVYQLLCKRKNKVTFITKIFGGGKHSPFKRPVFQEFLVFSKEKGKRSYEINKAVYEEAKNYLKQKKIKIIKDKEGGFAINKKEEEVLQIIKEIADRVKKNYKEKIYIGLDVAASSFYFKGKYKVNKTLSREEFINFVEELVKKYKIKYLEDPVEENDYKGYKKFMKHKILVCGDDLIATRVERLKKFNKYVNSVIIKPNQNYSLYETLQFSKLAKKYKLKRVFSHRSNETFEVVFADLAICLANYYKISFTKSRLEKIKRVIEILESKRF